MAHIPALEGAVIVNDWSIEAVSPGDKNGVIGTLYHGDPDIIADYIADPQGELDVYGILHHISVKYADDVFTLLVESVGAQSEARFDHKAAREIIFALAAVKTYENNPKR